MFWFGRKKGMLIQFARQVAEELYSKVPPALVEKHLSGGSRKATRSFEMGLKNASQEVAQFIADERPGIYGKAKLHQVLAARLRELGYPDKAAQAVTEHILIRTA